MVCIAAFIILGLTGLLAGFLSLFKPAIGKKWLALFKKSLHCFTKKIRLQKCDTAFDEDIKTLLLKKVVLKHPTWVKPISTALEILSALFVAITIWSLVIAIKSLLALWVFGTCNVTQPSQCGLGAEACSIDQAAPTTLVGKIGRSFEEWGEIFAAIPDRLKTWQATDYLPEKYLTIDPSAFATDSVTLPADAPLALDIFDPGCSVCLQSYKNQKTDGFFSRYRTAVLIYPIQNPDGTTKFANSDTVTRYLYAPYLYAQQDHAKLSATQRDHLTQLGTVVPTQMLNRLFTEYNDAGISYQALFINELNQSQVEQLLAQWYADFGYTKSEIKELATFANSTTVTDYLATVKDLVENHIHAKGIPTLIYDGRKHNGLYRLD